MDSCCSEWDDDDDLSAAGSSNYVTLNRPISRRRILESSQSQCDSEDSGIEYQSNNEDDLALEDPSSVEDRKDDLTPLEDDIHDQETATESDEEDVDEVSNQSLHGSLEHSSLRDAYDENIYASTEADTSADTIVVEATDDEQNHDSIKDDDDTNFVDNRLVSAQTGKNLFEEGSKEETTTSEAKGTTRYQQEYRPNEALENDNVVIVETSPPVPAKRTHEQQAGEDAAAAELRLKRETYTIRNKEVQLEELPRPHTVSSVKRLFEDLTTPVSHFHAWRDTGRFRDIKSNPSSKILRFDRSDSVNESLGATPTITISSSSSISRYPTGGSGSSFTLPTPRRSLPQQPQQQKQQDRSCRYNSSSSSSSSRSHKNSTAPQQLTAADIFTQHLHNSTKTSSQPTSPKSKPPQHQEVANQGGQSVALRKPTVRGFNVKKALLEDPRTFHAAHNRNTATTTTTNNNLHYQVTSRSHNQSNNHNNNNSKQLKDLHNRKIHFARTHHSSDALMDRSDTESLASDISEDSGVSNDSHTSASAHSSYRTFDAYASDPSFKVIDPAVMAKIRAVGTTVIFFGPRPRPRARGGGGGGSGGGGNSSTTTSSGLLHHSALLRNMHLPQSSKVSRLTNSSTSSSSSSNRTAPVAAPRIVGVVRKRNPSGGSTSSSNSCSTYTGSSSSPHLTPTPTPTPTDPGSDDSRASSPASTISRSSEVRKRGDLDTTVVYDFTRPHHAHVPPLV